MDRAPKHPRDHEVPYPISMRDNVRLLGQLGRYAEG